MKYLNTYKLFEFYTSTDAIDIATIKEDINMILIDMLDDDNFKLDIYMGKYWCNIELKNQNNENNLEKYTESLCHLYEYLINQKFGIGYIDIFLKVRYFQSEINLEEPKFEEFKSSLINNENNKLTKIKFSFYPVK